MVTLAAVVSLAANCLKPQPPNPEDQKVILDVSYNFNVAGGEVSINMTMDEDWTVTIKDGDKWCTIDQVSGARGSHTLTINVEANDTYSSRNCNITISSRHAVGKIAISQDQLDVLTADPLHIDVPTEGGEFPLDITANVDYSVTLTAEWLKLDDGRLTVEPNPDGEQRSAIVTLKSDYLSCQITVVQSPMEVIPPGPVDELDGIVTQLKSHVRGCGIPIVIIGDAFSHDEIEDGTYSSQVQKAVEAFFSVEPYATFEDMFDVYQVNVVSEYYEDFNAPGSTTLGTFFGSGTYANGDHSKCCEYALKAVSEENLDNTLVIILMNRVFHAGRCRMQLVRSDGSTEEIDDCTRGIAYAYTALGLDDDDFTILVRHEAGGHGFGRLADEYFYEGSGAITETALEEYRTIQRVFHAYRNVDFTSDPEEVSWAHFLEDERYQWDDLGVFEGACTWESGVWRPSQDGIMLSGTGGYNAPSREAIYYRIHKIAFGMEWEYDYEAFAEYDAVNRASVPVEPEPEPVQSTGRRARCLSPVIIR